LTLWAEDGQYFGVEHAFDLAQFAEAFEQVVGLQELSSCVHQSQRVSITNRHFLRLLDCATGNDVQISTVEVLGTVRLAIVVHVTCRGVDADGHSVGFAEEILDGEGVDCHYVDLSHHLHYIAFAFLLPHIFE
jgi:hypothetical protein